MTAWRRLAWLAARCLAALACAGTALAQDPGARGRGEPAPDAQAELDRLVATWRATGAAASARTDDLRAFVRRHAEREPAHASVLRARIDLGGLLLASLRLAEARVEFEAVATHAPRGAIDMRAHALFGISQATELLGDAAAARVLLDRLIDEFAGTRYADLARIARTRLESPRPVAGEPAPDFGARLDTSGKARSLVALRGRAAVLVFWAPADAEGAEHARAWCATARAAGMPTEQILAFALGPEPPPPAGEPRHLPATVVAASAGFLDDAVMRYRVASVPQCFVLGADGVVVARDPTPTRLAELLARLVVERR